MDDASRCKTATMRALVMCELSSCKVVSYIRGGEASFAVQIDANHDGLNNL